MWRPKKEIKRSQKIVQKVPQVYQSDFNYCEPKQYFYLFFLIWYNCNVSLFRLVMFLHFLLF